MKPIRATACVVSALAASLAACGGGSNVPGPAPGGPHVSAPPASAAPVAAVSTSPSPAPLVGASASPPPSAAPGSPASPAPSPVPSGFAPLDQAGPVLDVPATKLAASLACVGSLAPAAHTPVLLVPGTDTIPSVDFSWNYERDFAAGNVPYCTVTLPDSATNDIQIAGEYVVSAIRTMYAQTGAKIDVVGWSQGGMVPRWALRFWPDTRAMVDDVVGLAPSNHGTVVADTACRTTCTAANWQQRSQPNSHFMQALNSYAETFAGISYTNVYSHTDEVVQPNADASGSSSLHTGNGSIANVGVQDVCPADVADHFATGTYDAVAYAIANDALAHAGPAVASRIPATVCAQAYQPGVDPATFATDDATLVGYVGQHANDSASLPAEPPLAAYVFAR